MSQHGLLHRQVAPTPQPVASANWQDSVVQRRSGICRAPLICPTPPGSARGPRFPGLGPARTGCHLLHAAAVIRNHRHLGEGRSSAEAVTQQAHVVDSRSTVGAHIAPSSPPLERLSSTIRLFNVALFGAVPGVTHDRFKTWFGRGRVESDHLPEMHGSSVASKGSIRLKQLTCSRRTNTLMVGESSCSTLSSETGRTAA